MNAKQKDHRRGAEKRTRLETLNSKRVQKLKTGGTLGKAATSSNLAASNFSSNWFRARLLGNHGIHHGARKNAFDPSLGGSGCAAKGFRTVTEQGSHIGGPALVGTEMNS